MYKLYITVVYQTYEKNPTILLELLDSGLLFHLKSLLLPSQTIHPGK